MVYELYLNKAVTKDMKNKINLRAVSAPRGKV